MSYFIVNRATFDTCLCDKNRSKMVFRRNRLLRAGLLNSGAEKSFDSGTVRSSTHDIFIFIPSIYPEDWPQAQFYKCQYCCNKVM